MARGVYFRFDDDKNGWNTNIFATIKGEMGQLTNSLFIMEFLSW